MFPRRTLPALVVAITLLFVLGACGVFGDDDDDEGDATPGSNQPVSTRVVVMSTFTATVEVPPAEQTATEEVQQSELRLTATARAGIPTPTSAFEIDEEELLWPPRARLEAGGQLTEGYLGSYSWQFSDEVQTFGAIDAPITALDQGDPVAVRNGDDLTIRYYGNEFRTPPERLEVAIYDFESNSAIPLSPTGEQGEGLAFSVRTDPIQSMQIDPTDPTITIDGFQPGHYVIRAQGHWGDHPVIARPLFVTWLFDIEIME